VNRVVLDISMSLDGYITAAHQTATEPMGRDGVVLHDWAWGDDPAGQAIGATAIERYRAVIVGRTTYDHFLPWWGADGPNGAVRRPVFVVTNEAPAKIPEGGVYEFVSGGIEEALERATTAAGDGDIEVISASVARQFIEAGLLDEIVLHVVPVLFGAGTRLFDNLKIDHTWLDTIDVVQTSAATHQRYQVMKPKTVRI
jgi:dihydrofolate reductase